MEPYPLTEEQVASYQDNGFIRLEGVLTMAEVDALREGIARAIDDMHRQKLSLGPRTDAGYTKVFLQMVNLWERYPLFEEYVRHPRVAGIARRLARTSAVRLWHDQALIKYPKESKATVWHQDFPYWPMNEPGALSCWMALDEVTIQRGCMWFIPGSHKVGPLEPVDLGNVPADSPVAGLPESLCNAPRQAAELSPGSCTFHNGLTFHYAGPNLTEIPRRAMATIYMPAGTTYKSLPHIVGDRANLAPGEEFHGPLFPVASREP